MLENGPRLNGGPITEVELRAMIRWKASTFESESAAARDAGVSRQFLKMVLNGDRGPGNELLRWIGYDGPRIVLYTKNPNCN